MAEGSEHSRSGFHQAAVIAAPLILVLAVVVVATTGDSWAVRMILSVVAIDVSVRLFRWGRGIRT